MQGEAGHCGAEGRLVFVNDDTQAIVVLAGGSRFTLMLDGVSHGTVTSSGFGPMTVTVPAGAHRVRLGSGMNGSNEVDVVVPEGAAVRLRVGRNEKLETQLAVGSLFAGMFFGVLGVFAVLLPMLRRTKKPAHLITLELVDPPGPAS